MEATEWHHGQIELRDFDGEIIACSANGWLPLNNKKYSISFSCFLVARQSNHGIAVCCIKDWLLKLRVSVLDTQGQIRFERKKTDIDKTLNISSP